MTTPQFCRINASDTLPAGVILDISGTALTTGTALDIGDSG